MIQPSDVPWPLSPVTDLSPFLFLDYLLVFIAAGMFSRLVYKIWWRKKNSNVEKKDSKSFSLTKVLMAGPLEEMGFRGTAVLIASHFTLPIVPVLLVANGVWSGYHLRSFKTFAYTFVLGLFFTRFWMEGFDGLWWVAILAHSGHNLLVHTLQETVDETKEVDPRIKNNKASNSA